VPLFFHRGRTALLLKETLAGFKDMHKKRTSGGALLAVVICLIILLISNYYWAILIIVGLVVVVWIINKSYSSKKKPQTVSAATYPYPIRVTVSTGPYHPDFKAKSSTGDEFWVPPGQSIRIHGVDIGGMLYAGTGLESVGGGGPEPALIDKNLPIAREHDDCHIRHLSYWPSYWGATPEARSAFLRWLSTGRSDPGADIGYVFLYFYGLERRALHDAKTSAKAQAEIPIIKNEVERLLGIYTHSGSFQGYAGSLFDLLKTQETSEKLFEKNPPPPIMGRWLSFEHRLALAQCAAEGKALPADWAYVWLMGDPNTYLRTPGTRCSEEFKKLFFHHYSIEYGQGMILPQNRTQLKLQHRAASPTFGYQGGDFKKKFDLPDVSVLTAPVNRLREIAEVCCTELDGFSRIIGKDKASADSYSAISELPLVLWPYKYRQSLDDLRKAVFETDVPYIISFKKFTSYFPNWQEATKQNILATCRSLENADLGMEPDIRYGGSIPLADTDIALFRCEKQQAQSILKERYIAAALSLRLAAAVVFADGVASEIEKRLLQKQIDAWAHLNEAERTRLHAYLCMLFLRPPKLVGLKKQIGSLEASARETIANFLIIVAQIDSAIEPEEVCALEKIFKALGLDPKLVYTKMHVAAVEPITVSQPESEAGGYKIPRPPEEGRKPLVMLNANKIASLQNDSERVSAILSQIFTQETYEPQSVDEPECELPNADHKGLSLMGLNAEHSTLLQLLLRRTQWTRMELEEIAEDRKILLDGMLECINDKSYSLFNKPLFEGEDPMVLDPEVVREVLK
jgi:tellurite resistance protein